MRRKFLIWLSTVIFTVFVLTVGVAYVNFTEHAEDRATATLKNRLNDLMGLLLHANDSTQHVMELNDAGALQRTRAFAEMLRLNPSLLTDQEALQTVANELGVEQICITDGEGCVIAAVPITNVGYDLAEYEQSREFLACLDDPDLEICQRPRANGQDNLPMQYTGIHRKDAPGIVQLGIVTTHEQMVRSNASFGNLAASYQLGENGFIIAYHDGEMLNKSTLPYAETDLLSLPLDKAEVIQMGDKTYFAYALERRHYRLVGLLPTEEVEADSMRAIRSLLFSNLLVFLLLFVVVSFLLQHYVVRGIRQVTEALRRITDGDFNVRVEVEDTPEMSRLSADINAMVDTLQSMGEEKRDSMHRELELARSIQMSAMPGKFPAFPSRQEFDLYAVCHPALTVGGDFYDFFLQDDDHLGFLVADNTESGIPAALNMMRTLSIIRSLARSGADPVTLVSETNRELCESGNGEVRLGLFFGSLEISTGTLRFVNAGVPQALLQHAGQPYEMLSMRSGMVMGAYREAVYNLCTLQLQPGDRLFLYTEGVPAVTDAYNTPFGEAGLQQALSVSAQTVSEVLLQVRSALRRFMNDSEQREDITMLALEYQGRKRSESSLCVAAGQPDEVHEMLQTRMESVFAAPSDIADMQACSNAVLAALPQDLPVNVELVCDETEAALSFRYGGGRSNPLIGLPHLPIHAVRYSFDTENHLSLTKKLI